MKRKIYIDKITDLLVSLARKVELYNSLNLTDINIFSENFYRDFLNILYGYNLTSINIEEPNAAAIDLGDLNEKIAIQVTSTKNLSKIKKTIDLFVSKGFCNLYEKLIILNIVKKIKHNKDFIGDPKKYQLSTRDHIWDTSNLIKKINDLELDNIIKVFNFLDKEIKIDDPDILPKEIQTFLILIEALSDSEQQAAGSAYIEEPDPQGKIEGRFFMDAKFLKNEFKDLYAEYGQILDDVLRSADMGPVRIRRLGLHLKNISNQALIRCNGSPKEALTLLVNDFCKIISGRRMEYDESAVRFFLTDQLIRCNVFPNVEPIDA